MRSLVECNEKDNSTWLLILTCLANFSSRNGDFYFSLKRLNLCHILTVYIHKNMFWAHCKKCWLLNKSLVSQYNTFLQCILHDIQIIYLIPYINKTVKQMCVYVLLKLNIKLVYGIKQITQKINIIITEFNKKKLFISYINWYIIVIVCKGGIRCADVKLFSFMVMGLMCVNRNACARKPWSAYCR